MDHLPCHYHVHRETPHLKKGYTLYTARSFMDTLFMMDEKQ